MAEGGEEEDALNRSVDIGELEQKLKVGYEPKNLFGGILSLFAVLYITMESINIFISLYI